MKGRSLADTTPMPLVAATLTDTMRVKSPEGKAIGSVHAFMVHKRSGRALFAVLSLGGFLGMGKSFYPVPVQLLAYDAAGDFYSSSLEPKVLEGGPSWSSTPPDFDQAYADRLASYYAADKVDLVVG